MAEFVDYYKLLEVDCEASIVRIEKAYKSLALEHHPDRGGDVEVMKQLTAAYYTLKEPERRHRYDEVYHDEMEHLAGSTDQRLLSIDDVPQEVIDALLSAVWIEGAAATARVAGRRVAATGASVVAFVRDSIEEDKELERQRVALQLEIESARLQKARSRGLDEELSWWLDACLEAERTHKGRAPTMPEFGTTDEYSMLALQTSSVMARSKARGKLRRSGFTVLGHCISCGQEVEVTGAETCAACGAHVRSDRVLASRDPEVLELRRLEAESDPGPFDVLDDEDASPDGAESRPSRTSGPGMLVALCAVIGGLLVVLIRLVLVS